MSVTLFIGSWIRLNEAFDDCVGDLFVLLSKVLSINANATRDTALVFWFLRGWRPMLVRPFSVAMILLATCSVVHAQSCTLSKALWPSGAANVGADPSSLCYGTLPQQIKQAETPVSQGGGGWFPGTCTNQILGISDTNQTTGYCDYQIICGAGPVTDHWTWSCDTGYFTNTPVDLQPQCGPTENCVGEPINPTSGATFDTFSDINQTTTSDFSIFSRTYNSTDTSNVSSDVSNSWRHSYSRRITVKYSTLTTQTYLQSANTSSRYSNPSAACTSGFAEIKSRVPQWASALASYSNGNCVLSKNGSFVGAISVHSTGGSFAPAPTPAAYDVIRDDGQLIRFIVDGFGAIVTPPGMSVKLQKTASGFTVTDNNDNIEQYDTNGKLLTVTSRAGVSQTINYDGSGRLGGVNDSFGHQLNFGYDAQGHLSTVTRQ